MQYKAAKFLFEAQIFLKYGENVHLNVKSNTLCTLYQNVDVSVGDIKQYMV